MLHEIGHFVGMEHTESKNHIMNPTIANRGMNGYIELIDMYKKRQGEIFSLFNIFEVFK